MDGGAADVEAHVARLEGLDETKRARGAVVEADLHGRRSPVGGGRGDSGDGGLAAVPPARHLAGIKDQPPASSRPEWLVADLRSDRAGETGAVAICRGILACCKDPAIREFAARHLGTERRHLRRFELMLPATDRFRLLPAWKVAGFLVGALPALAGPRAVYATIDAVESFVDRHYQTQVKRLDAERSHPDLRALLAECQAEEVHHRDGARERHGGLVGAALRAWGVAVEAGSAAAVAAARRV